VLDPSRRSNDARDFEGALRRKMSAGPGDRKGRGNLSDVSCRTERPGPSRGQPSIPGPTGSGKTRVVEAVAESLFGDARACIKIDCAEFQHSHEIAKAHRLPPGYLRPTVERHPLLTQEALNQWHTEKLKLSILLFDEIEKASDSLWQLLLGILDKATLTLATTAASIFPAASSS